MENLSLGISIGAALTASFQHTIEAAPKKLSKIGDTLRAIERQDVTFSGLQKAESKLTETTEKVKQVGAALAEVRAKIAKAESDAAAGIFRDDLKPKSLLNAEAALEKTRTHLGHVSRELLRVKAAMRGADGKELQTLTASAATLETQQTKLAAAVEKARSRMEKAQGRALKAAQKETDELKQKAQQLERQESSLADSVARASERVKKEAQALREASQAADAQRNSLGKLGKSLEEIRAHEVALKNAVSARSRAQEQLGKARGGVIEAVAIGVGMTAAFSASATLKSTLVDIGVTAGLTANEVGKIGERLDAVAQSSGQSKTALAEGLQKLISAGMDAEPAMASIEAIGKTATASGAQVEDVSQTVFSLMQNLRVAPGEALKAMDMLTAAGKAGSFELKDMAKYLPAMTADAAKLGLVGTPAVAALGASLQVAMKGAGDPSEAANNMKNYMAKLTAPETVKRFAEMGVNIEKEFKGWAAKGLNPIEESLKRVQELTGGGAFRIGELFNDMQVKSFITPSIPNSYS